MYPAAGRSGLLLGRIVRPAHDPRATEEYLARTGKLKLYVKYCNVHAPGLHGCGPGGEFGDGSHFLGCGVRKHGIDE